ncbi:HTTM domain-containing protein [Bdellovibrio sp. SKB1291214]|uniref:HTTM domain-containing protein n=1 Tax=Bdellovibrio sp. SKB1291214 TaxID=1732569 RepID=UPI000B69CB8B|nr:HTTM domain-containing protein [Bdellovibrio sp. SKB1291214]UYL08940.1 HTTM domain-containing protein [Bdellovibrio sp. SKB1291214]
MRVIFGLLLIFNWYMIWSYLDVFWGVDGLISLKTSLEYGSTIRFSLFDLMPNDPRVPALLALLNLVASIGVTLGLFTRTSMVLAFITLLSFQNRNDFILNSGDIVLRNILFFMMFSAAGKAYSVDQWIQSLRLGKSLQPKMERPWALRLIQIQFCVIYIATVLFKIKGSHWVDGTAVYIATRLDEFVRVPVPLLNNLALIKFMTWSTLVVELAMGTLVWFKDLRYWVLLAGIGLHLGIELVMSIPMFEWVMITTMLSLVDPYDVIRVERYLRESVSKFRYRFSKMESA